MHDHSRLASHNECNELLPWLVNGTLAAADRQRLEAHLAGCADCRAEAAEQSLLREHMLREDSVLYAPQTSLQKMMSRIDAAAQKPSSTADHDGQLFVGRNTARRSRSAWPHARSLAATFVAGTLAIVATVSVLSWRAFDERQAARYSTLTSGSGDSMSVPAARVVFAPTTSVARLSELLRRHHARVVAGPTEAGVYTLTFSAADAGTDRTAVDGEASSSTTDSARQVESSIVALRAEPDVLFAEPVLTSLAPR